MKIANSGADTSGSEGVGARMLNCESGVRSGVLETLWPVMYDE